MSWSSLMQPRKMDTLDIKGSIKKICMVCKLLHAQLPSNEQEAANVIACKSRQNSNIGPNRAAITQEAYNKSTQQSQLLVDTASIVTYLQGKFCTASLFCGYWAVQVVERTSLKRWVRKRNSQRWVFCLSWLERPLALLL